MSPAIHHDAVIVVGGLAGLSAAAFLARAGRRVVVVEKSEQPGGRARTTRDAGCHLNLGPHAPYRSGAAWHERHALGITPTGATPASSGSFAILGNRRFALPGGPVSLLTTGLLGLPGKPELARWPGGIARLDSSACDRITVRCWLDAAIHDPTARALLQSLLRLTSYANAPDLPSAGANLRQLQEGLADSVLCIVRETGAARDVGGANVKVTLLRARRAMQACDRDRPASMREARARSRKALGRFVANLLDGDADAVQKLLRSDAVAIGDGGGEYLAARNVGRDRVTRLQFGLRRFHRDGANLIVRMINGLPAPVLDRSSAPERFAPRAVIAVQLEPDGAITAL